MWLFLYWTTRTYVEMTNEKKKRKKGKKPTVINATVPWVSDTPWKVFALIILYFLRCKFHHKTLGSYMGKADKLSNTILQPQNWWNLTGSSHWSHIHGNSTRTYLLVDYVKIGQYGYCVIYFVYMEASAPRSYTTGMFHLWILECRVCHNYCFQRSALSFKLSGTHLHVDTFGEDIGLGNRQD